MRRDDWGVTAAAFFWTLAILLWGAVIATYSPQHSQTWWLLPYSAGVSTFVALVISISGL